MDTFKTDFLGDFVDTPKYDFFSIFVDTFKTDFLGDFVDTPQVWVFFNILDTFKTDFLGDFVDTPKYDFFYHILDDLQNNEFLGDFERHLTAYELFKKYVSTTFKTDFLGSFNSCPY